ncbi:hypothetical protein [Kineococcus rubinsiae]|uniref:hypothetical protein n=1 Tax=Kineococcus rubinsiae TaxID=2609562 RepID=UPI001432259F|nr:hypothetical protein [Kineococcus rubinsiae]
MPLVAIDPDGVLAMSAATATAAAALGGRARELQQRLDGLSALAGPGPAVRSRAWAVEEDLAALAGVARERAQQYVDVEVPLRELLGLGFWMPDPGNLAVRTDESVTANIERMLRSDEFGAVPLGLSQSLLTAYRKPLLALPAPGSILLDLDFTRPANVVDQVRGVPLVQRPSGLLVPVGSSADPAVEVVTALSKGPDVHQPGERFLTTGGFGRPPAWARTSGRALGVVGAGLTVYDSFAGQWEHDQRYHPEYGTGRRVAEASAVAATEGVGAVAGGIYGAQLGATVGSFIPIPVVGTVGGALVGGAIGAFVGSKAGKAGGRVLREGGHALWKKVFG